MAALPLRAIVLVLCVTTSAVAGQEQGQAPPAAAATTPSLRDTALDLSHRGRHVEALPLLEDLTGAFSGDLLLWERYAVSLLTVASTLPDEAASRQMRLRAKQAFARTRALGNTSALAALGDLILPDGSMPPLARHPDAQSSMTAGEAAFARGEFKEAIGHYLKAVELEPANYNATLFVGDSYFRLKDVERAGEWFARAIAINPSIETAYRYWGDALLGANRLAEAKTRFMDAMIAEPYNRATQEAISRWGKAAGAKFGRPDLRPPADLIKLLGTPGSTIDAAALGFAPSDGMGAAWVAYAQARVQFAAEEFRKRFPSEPGYRHTISEELYAFDRMIALANDLEAKGQPITDPQMKTIRSLLGSGMLEPYFFLHAADAGIVQDYPAFRAEHRARLQQYVEAMIIMSPR